MPSPVFSLSLDEFPGLLDVLPTSEAFLGETVVNALREALASFPVLDYPQLELTLNELRQKFELKGDEDNSMAVADLMLAIAPQYSYMLNILGKRDPETEPEKFVRSLLDKAARFSALPALYANCLWRASRLCQKAELQEVARTLFLLWQGLPTPSYPQLDWLKLPFKRTDSSLRPFITSQHHPLTTPAEVVENAYNGWRDERWNPISRQQDILLRSLIEKHEVQPWTDMIVSMSQNCVRFERTSYKRAFVGISRFGGLPDVPRGWVWPQNLEFLAQFNLEEIAPCDVNHALPSHGLLRFFAGNIWSGDIEKCRVEWDETPIEQLRPARCPADYAVRGLEEVDNTHPIVYSPIPVVPCRIISVESEPIYDYYESVGLLEEDYSDHVEDIREEFLPSHVLRWNHQLLGSYYDGQKDSYEWAILFQIDSNDDLGTRFSDVGTVYFMIHREDLAARRFDRVSVTLTCG